MSYPIIITCIGGGLSYQTISLIKNSKIHENIKIIGVDSTPNPYAKEICDFSYQIPNGSSNSYIREILKIVDKHNVKLIIPCSDEETYQLSKNIEIFSKKKINIACSNFQSFQIISNKIKTYKFLNKLNIKTPIWKSGNSKKTIINSIIDLFDSNINHLIVKPAKGRGSRDIIIISKDKQKSPSFFENYDLNEFKKSFNYYFKKQNYIISEKLNNPVFDLDFLTWKGKVLQSTFRKRIKSELPNDGHVITNIPSDIENSIKLISDKLKLSWLYDCDWMIDHYGNYKLIEINPRMSGSIASSIKAGANYLDNLISLSKRQNYIVKNAKKDISILPVKILIKSKL